MILCRKPCTLYDVDVIGLVALAAVGLAACFGVVLPARAGANEYRALAARISDADAKAQQAGQRIREVNAKVAALQQGVAERASAAPKPGAFTEFLQQVASVAQQCDLQIAQVVPQPTQLADGYRFADVHYVARGRSLDFARLLDQLARDNPYLRVLDFAIVGTADPQQPLCKLTWSLRLYMLEEGSPATAGAQP